MPSRTHGSCPYCAGSTLVKSNDGTVPRPPGQTLMWCPSCSKYSAKIPSGFVFPLARNRVGDDPGTDPDTDAMAFVP